MRAVFTNPAGSATTNPATITVLADIAPMVTAQPLSQSVASGGTLTFTAAASGEPTPTVYWQLSLNGGSAWIDLRWLTTTSFTTGPLTAFVNGWEVRAVFTNPAGSATTNPATIHVS